MNGIFCGKASSSNEEYKKVIRFRMRIFCVLSLVGAVTFSGTLFIMFRFSSILSDYQSGVYSGIGCGLMGAAVALWIKNKMLLGNEEKLKQSRLANSDERNIEISQKAMRIAAMALIVALYLVGIVGGFFYPVLIKVLLFLVCIFLLVYVVAFKMIDKKM